MRHLYITLLALLVFSTGTLVAQTLTPATNWLAKPTSGSSTVTLTKSSSGWGSGTNYNLQNAPTGFSLGTISGNNVPVNVSTAASYGANTVKLRNGTTGNPPNASAVINVYGTPALTTSSPATVAVPATAALSGSFTANGNTVVGYSWAQTSGPAGGSSISGGTTNTPTVSFSIAGTYTFTETVTYSHGGSAITITDVTNAIVVTIPSVTISAGSGTTILAGQSVSFSSSNSNFHSGTQTNTWTISPSTGVTGATGANPTITFANEGTYTVKLTVSVNSPGQSAQSNTVTVTVSNINHPRPFATPMYTGNFKGGHTMLGNTIMAAYSSGTGNTGGTINTGATDNHTNMQFVNVDHASGNPQHVTASSSANLVLPSGTNTIKFARLYWGGRVSNSDIVGGSDLTNLKSVKIRKGTSGAYTTLTVGSSQINAVPVDGATNATAYQSWADITSFISSSASGTTTTYTVADVMASTGTTADDYGNYAGWSIVVAYQNDALDYYAVRLYDAFQQVVTNAAEQSVTLTGFNAPSAALLNNEAYLSAFVWEGDYSYTGDYLKINGTKFQNGANPVDNMWNSSISDPSGSLVHTQNPNLTTQLGVDIDQVYVGTGYGILPNASSVNISFGTDLDEYFPSILAFSMRIKDPQLNITKAALDLNNDTLATLAPNQTINYVIYGQNTGTGSSTSTFIVDSLPADLTYVPGSLYITKSGTGGPTGAMGDAKNDNDEAYYTAANAGRKAYIVFYLGSGATATHGGTLLSGDKYEVHLKALSSSDVNDLTVTNIAEVSTSTFLLGPVTIPATSSLSGPQGSPPVDLPIRLGNFIVSKQGTNAILNWNTLLEVDNDHFDIERSTDGINFIKIGTVMGHLTSSLTNNYQYADPINGLSGVIYYRLRNVDIDNTGRYSKIVALRINGSAVSVDFSVYPNPFVSDIKLTVSSKTETTAAVRMINVSGQQLSSRSVTLQQGSNVVVLQGLDSMKPGIYIVELISEGQKFTQKIIKK